MAQIILPEETSNVTKLANIFKDVVKQWTTISRDTTIEDVTEALAFTAGYAIGNRPKSDRTRISTRILRERSVDRLDKGIAAAEAANGEEKIIVPADNGNKISLVK